MKITEEMKAEALLDMPIGKWEDDEWDAWIAQYHDTIQAALQPSPQPDTVTCKSYQGTKWVCEDHTDKPWNDGDGCCGGAGMPCRACHAKPDTVTISRETLAAFINQVEINDYQDSHIHDLKMNARYIELKSLLNAEGKVVE